MFCEDLGEPENPGERVVTFIKPIVGPRCVHSFLTSFVCQIFTLGLLTQILFSRYVIK